MLQANQNKLISLIGAAVLSSLALVGYLLYEERTRILNDAERELATIVGTISGHFSLLNAEAISIRNSVQPHFTRFLLEEGAGGDHIENRLSYIASLDPHLIEVVIFSGDGRRIASSSGIAFSEPVIQGLATPTLEPRFLVSQRLISGLSAGRIVSTITIGLKGLDSRASAYLVLIFDNKKYFEFIEFSRANEHVHLTITNGDGELIVDRQASIGEEAGHHSYPIEHSIKPDGTNIQVHAHMSASAALAENWNNLARLVGVTGLILVLVSAAGLWQLVRLDSRRAEAKNIADRRLQRLNAIFKAAPDAILTVDASSIIQSANASAAGLFGYPVETLIGSSIDTLIPKQFHSVHKLHVERFLTDPQGQTVTMGDWRQVHCITASGREVPIFASLGRLSNDKKSDTLIMVRDMSDAKVTDDNLRQLSFELARELEAAKEADRAKSAFLAQMSHELRTPLNAIIGFSEASKLELFGKISPSVYRDYAEDIHRSGIHLLSLVNDILDFSKIDANKQDLTMDRLEVRPLIEETLRVLRPIASENGVRLRCKNSRLIDELFADRRALYQCLLNLLSNAIRHSNKGSKVILEAWVTADTSEIHIVDHGIGISEENLKSVGKPFEQFEDPMTSKREGTGLGLAITKSLMELMQGRLELESKEGVGTRAKLIFPIEKGRVRAN